MKATGSEYEVNIQSNHTAFEILVQRDFLSFILPPFLSFVLFATKWAKYHSFVVGGRIANFEYTGK